MFFNTDLFKPEDTVLAGISGGKDSVVLLHYLQQLPVKTIVVHFNHQIRGVTAARDADFVRMLAEKYQCPFILGTGNVPQYAEQNKLSIEDAARQLRYSFFIQEAKKLNKAKIALAHNQDDQIETIIMRFLRGAAAKGLSGMAWSRTEQGVEIVRPLLDTSRELIEKYAQENKLVNIEDETNQETIYLRNKIRRELLPVLKEFNPNLADSLLRMSEILKADDDYLQKIADELFADILIKQSECKIKLDIISLKHYPLAIQRRVVRAAIEQLCGSVNTISLAFVENFLVNNLNTLYLNEEQILQVSKE